MIASSLCVGSRAKAAEVMTSNLLMENESDAIHFAPRTDSATVKIENDNYLNYAEPAFRPGAEQSDPSVTLKVKTDDRIVPGIRFKLDASDSYHGGEQANYVDVFQADFSARLGAVKLDVGRKLETWSSWDERWNQGLFQPRYLENRLHPQTAGLTGIFASFKSERSTFTLAALPIYIPDFGPQFQVANGRFVSANPWFNPPASQFVYRGATNDIRYGLSAPSTADVLAHPGGAAKWEYDTDHYRSRASVAVKPMAPFAQGFPSAHPLVVGASGDFVNIEITPRVVYAAVANVDQEFHYENWSTSFSVAFENPEDTSAPSDWTAQRQSPATIYAAAVTHKGELFSRPLLGEMGFLKVSGGDAPDTGPFAAQQTLFDRRFQFYEAYTLSLATNFQVFRHLLSAKGSVIYDRLQNGGVVSLVSGYAFSKDWLASVDVDIMGLLQADAPMPDGFLAAYRANSRMGLGVSYVF